MTATVRWEREMEKETGRGRKDRYCHSSPLIRVFTYSTFVYGNGQRPLCCSRRRPLNCALVGYGGEWSGGRRSGGPTSNPSSIPPAHWGEGRSRSQSDFEPAPLSWLLALGNGSTSTWTLPFLFSSTLSSAISCSDLLRNIL